MNKHYYIVLDTETTSPTNNLFDSLVYDLGGVVTDRYGNIYETFSFVIKELWADRLELLKTAYYCEKLPQYMKDLLESKRELVTFEFAKQYIEMLCKKYKVKAIMAHNSMFDYRVLNNTQEELTGHRNFFPKEIEIWDTMKMAKSVIATKKSYQKFCEEHGYMTKHKTPRAKLTAEVLYRFIIQDNSFIEEHTGLADATIESQIFAYCVKQKKPMEKSLFK